MIIIYRTVLYSIFFWWMYYNPKCKKPINWKVQHLPWAGLVCCSTSFKEAVFCVHKLQCDGTFYPPCRHTRRGRKGVVTPPPLKQFRKPRKFSQMLGKMKKIRTNLSQNVLRPGCFSTTHIKIWDYFSWHPRKDQPCMLNAPPPKISMVHSMSCFCKNRTDYMLSAINTNPQSASKGTFYSFVQLNLQKLNKIYTS